MKFLIRTLVIIAFLIFSTSCGTLNYQSGLGLQDPNATSRSGGSNPKITNPGTSNLFYSLSDMSIKVELPYNIFYTFRKDVALVLFYIPVFPFIDSMREVKKHSFTLPPPSLTSKVTISFSASTGLFSSTDEKVKQSEGIFENVVFDTSKIYIVKDGKKITAANYYNYKTLRNTPINNHIQFDFNKNKRKFFQLNFSISQDELMNSQLIFEGLLKNGQIIKETEIKIDIIKSEGYEYSLYGA